MQRRPKPTVEFATTTWVDPGGGAAAARDAEALGYDVQAFGVNECMSAEVFAELRAAAAATERIRLMPAVANFVTRHPVVVAGGCATLDLVSGGRAVCGIGKGDSPVGMLGLRPQRHDDYVASARLCRAYLRGEEEPVDGLPRRLRWLPPTSAPVELDMFASGPRSIEAAAAIADRITLAVGANPERIRWALGIIDRTLAATGRSRAEVSIGACIPFAVDDDPERAEASLRPMVLGWAHMSSFPGNDLSTQPDIMREVTTAARTGYSYAYHDTSTSGANPLLDGVKPEFVRWFGIAGDARTVADRLLELHGLGVERFFVATERVQQERLALQVAPLVRAAVKAGVA